MRCGELEPQSWKDGDRGCFPSVSVAYEESVKPIEILTEKNKVRSNIQRFLVFHVRVHTQKYSQCPQIRKSK